MARALQNILRKNQPRVRYSKRKAALLMALANDNHKTIAELLETWIQPLPLYNEKKSPNLLKKLNKPNITG